MIGLYLIACHMAGDYLFQSSTMAARKLTDRRWRLWHVVVYTACFVPVAAVFTGSASLAVTFLLCLGFLHFLTDSKRWRTANPWPAMPILQDQSLHIVQIAILGGLLDRKSVV